MALGPEGFRDVLFKEGDTGLVEHFGNIREKCVDKGSVVSAFGAKSLSFHNVKCAR